MEPWLRLLRGGDTEAAWDSFVTDYRRLIFAAIRHYVSDADDVMDVFARVCEALRADDFHRLRRFEESAHGRVRCSTWLVTVVRRQTIDWLRARDGRSRRQPPPLLSPLQQRIYQHVFVEHRTHRECFHLLTIADGLSVTEHEFAVALADTYRRAPADRRDHRRALRLAGPLPDGLADASAPASEDGAGLREALAVLSPKDRLAVQLYVVDELSAADVATIVGWPSPKTVYNHVTRALQTLRAHLKQGASREAE